MHGIPVGIGSDAVELALAAAKENSHIARGSEGTMNLQRNPVMRVAIAASAATLFFSRI